MSARRTRAMLVGALVISLVLHLLLAGVLRWPAFFQAEPQPTIVRIRRLTMRHLPHPLPVPSQAPTPPPTPPPTPRPLKGPPVPPLHSAVHRARARAKPVSHGPGRAAGSGKQRVVSPASPAPGTPAPVVSATPAAACPHPNASPAVQAAPDVPPIPGTVRAQKTTGTTSVVVALDATGRVLNASVAQSSGNAGLDTIAQQMARAATYSPRYIGCRGIASLYTFIVDFRAW